MGLLDIVAQIKEGASYWHRKRMPETTQTIDYLDTLSVHISNALSLAAISFIVGL